MTQDLLSDLHLSYAPYRQTKMTIPVMERDGKKTWSNGKKKGAGFLKENQIFGISAFSLIMCLFVRSPLLSYISLTLLFSGMRHTQVFYHIVAFCKE